MLHVLRNDFDTPRLGFVSTRGRTTLLESRSPVKQGLERSRSGSSIKRGR